MKIDDYEYQLARAAAKTLGCSPKEAVELAVRTTVDVLLQSDSEAIVRIFKEQVAVAREVKAATKPLRDAVEGRREERKAIRKRADAKPKGLTHNPFKALLEKKE